MRPIIAMMVGWLACSTLVAAQSDSARVQAQANWQNVMGLQPEQTVRVRATDGRGATGRVFRVDDTHIEVLSRFKDVARFRREDVQLVEKLVGDPDAKKRGVKKGFLWGALISALGTFGPVMAGAPEGLPYMYGTLMGGGAAIGALTAESNASWIAIYRM